MNPKCYKSFKIVAKVLYNSRCIRIYRIRIENQQNSFSYPKKLNANWIKG